MQLHELKPTHPQKKSRRIGRGGKKGSACGRGMKGQSARSGRRLQPIIRSLIKRYPKLRGYRFSAMGGKSQTLIVNLDTLEKRFDSGETVNPQTLIEKRLIRKIKGGFPLIKILGQGELTKSLTIENCLVSKSAKDKIEKANGVVK